MLFDLNKTIEILERTPQIINDLLSGISDDWTMNNEGEGTWSPYDVVGHLINSEKTNWVSRIDIILNKKDKNFIPI